MGEKSARQAIGLRMDKKLWHQLKIEAVKQDRTCGDLVEDLLRAYLGQKPKASPQLSTQKTDQGYDHAEVERLIREHDQMNARHLADLLNDSGYTTARGRMWSINTVNKARLKLRKAGAI